MSVCVCVYECGVGVDVGVSRVGVGVLIELTRARFGDYDHVFTTPIFLDITTHIYS